jgi:hypothetical protein
MIVMAYTGVRAWKRHIRQKQWEALVSFRPKETDNNKESFSEK